MKKCGRKAIHSMEKINGAIADYENSELSWDDIEVKHKIPKATLMYYRKKRKEQDNAKKD